MFASAWLTDPFRNIYRTQRPSVNAPTIHPENAPARAAVSPGGAAAGSRHMKQCPTPSSIREVQLKTTGGIATRLSKTMAMGKGDNVKLWQGWTAKRCSGKVRQSLEKASMQPPRLNFVTCTPEEGPCPYTPTQRRRVLESTTRRERHLQGWRFRLIFVFMLLECSVQPQLRMKTKLPF